MDESEPQNPTLYVVATPIGNLGDITLRAIETLKKVDFVVSENTSETAKLLNHYKITAKQLTYRDEDKHKRIPQILELLNSGQNVALTTDSGTPLISDPGFKLVRAVLDSNFSVITIPGPSAVISALSISGLPTDKFSFVGFLPKKGGQRKDIILEYGALDATLIIYESPYRILKTLQDVYELLGNRYVCVAKELTKLHETLFYGKVIELLKSLPNRNLKGEFVILIAKDGFEV